MRFFNTKKLKKFVKSKTFPLVAFCFALAYFLSVPKMSLSSSSSTAIGNNGKMNMSQIIMSFAKIGEQCSGVDKSLVMAVIKTESGGRPFCVNNNDNKTSKCFNTKEDARKFIYRVGESNIDVGLMQVNYKTWRKLGVTIDHLLDPFANVCIGSQILANYLVENTHFNGWGGVGRYNARTPHKQVRYIGLVYNNWIKVLKGEF